MSKTVSIVTRKPAWALEFQVSGEVEWWNLRFIVKYLLSDI